MIIKYKFLFIVLMFAASCEQIDLHEQHHTIKDAAWLTSDTAAGSFIISDSNSAYKMSVALRHTDAYNYNNIWLSVGLRPPGDTFHYQKINMALGSDATGWHGTGTGDIWEVRLPLNDRPQRFKNTGEYEYTIVQIMRQNPLEEVLSAGMRVEKAE